MDNLNSTEAEVPETEAEGDEGERENAEGGLKKGESIYEISVEDAPIIDVGIEVLLSQHLCFICYYYYLPLKTGRKGWCKIRRRRCSTKT
jgi:hypothetical protein